MAAAYGYDLPTFQNFIEPLREVYSDDIVLLVDVKSLRDVKYRHFAQQHRVKFRRLEQSTRLGARGDRFMAYAKICLQYVWCLASDFRDVMFQSNPFVMLRGMNHTHTFDLLLFEEAHRVKLGSHVVPLCSPKIVTDCTCPYNSAWIETCWGKAFLDHIAEKTPICSGIIIGTKLGFQALADAMLSEMEKTKLRHGCTARDQGHLNYLYHSDTLKTRMFVQKQGEGIVNTVGYVPSNDIILDTDGKVRNRDGSLPAVIHQYDRLPQLRALFSRLQEEKRSYL